MIYRHKQFIYLFIILFLFLFSCSGEYKKIKEGKLVYKITYETSREENPIVIILPKQMVTYFKDNNTVSTIEGGLGTFQLKLITRYDLGKKFALVRIMDKRYIYIADTSEASLGADEMPNLKITLTDQTTVYNNYECKIAKAYCPSISKDTFDLLYTEQIKVKSPNVNTPFSKIPGVLVKMKMKLFGFVMDLELVKVEKQKVDSKVFEIPKKNYKILSRKQLETILKSFQE